MYRFSFLKAIFFKKTYFILGRAASFSFIFLIIKSQGQEQEKIQVENENYLKYCPFKKKIIVHLCKINHLIKKNLEKNKR